MDSDYYRASDPLPLGRSTVKQHIPEEGYEHITQSLVRKRFASTQIKDAQMAYTESEIKEQKGLRLFPVFGDHRMSMFSMNYALYMEFFHIMVRILMRLLLFVVFFNLIEFGSKEFLVEHAQYSKAEIVALCGDNLSDNDRNMCAREKLFRGEMYANAVRVLYSIVSSIIAACFLVHIRTKDEKRVINNRMLYEFNWTQDLFSVLVDKLPKETTADELRAYFNSLPSLQKIDGSVKDVVLVQDFTRVHEIAKQIFHIEDTLPKKEGTEEYTEDLQKIQRLKDELAREKARLPPHSGRAIVVFDSLSTKSLVMKLYRPSLASTWERKYRKSRDGVAPGLEEAYLNVKELPEPQDLKFQNICYPWGKKVQRLFFVYMLGLLIIIIGSLIGGGLEVFHELDELIAERREKIHCMFEATIVNNTVNIPDPHHHEESGFSAILFSYATPIILLLIEGITERLFKKSNKLTKHKSESEVEVSFLTYVIFSSFFLYLFVQGLVMAFSWENGGSLIRKTIQIFCLKYVGKKVASAYFCYRNKRNPHHNAHHGHHAHQESHAHDQSHDSSHSAPSPTIKKLGGHGHGHAKKSWRQYLSYEFMKIFFHVDIENEEFEFFEEASRAFPLIAMNLAFMANGSRIMVWFKIVPTSIPLTIGALYIGALCDKYRLMNQHEHCKLNSARFMLKMFKFLKGDHFAAVFGAAIWVTSFFSYILFYQVEADKLAFDDMSAGYKAILDEDIKNFNIICGGVVGVIILSYIFYVIIVPSTSSMEERFSKKFLASKSNVPYDSVSPYFTAVYEAPDYSFDNDDHKHDDVL